MIPLIKIVTEILFRKVLFRFDCLDAGQCEHPNEEAAERNNTSKGP